MNTLIKALALFLVLFPQIARADLPPTRVDDEGVKKATAATWFDYVGAGVTVACVGRKCTVTIPGGAGSGDNVTVNGSAADTTANFKDANGFTWTLVDGGAGGPDDVQVDLQNAAADGATKGKASFSATYFDASSGNITPDLTNGLASGSQGGWLSSANWSTFNGKQDTITWGAGLANTGATGRTASGEADFLASGALVCGASTQGKMQVHTTPLQYCDNAATPALQYAAYGDSAGASTLAATEAYDATGWNGDTAPPQKDAVRDQFEAEPSATRTLTNKTLDVEGTGNSITTVSKIWIDAAMCQNTTASLNWDTPTSNPAVAACVTGTNTQKGVADFADGANALSMQRTIRLPADWTGSMDATFKWFSGTTTNNVVWQIATICVADAETDDPAFNSASTVTDTAKGTANQTNDATITGVTTTGCAAGELMHIKVTRDPTNGSDNHAATARLIGVELTLRRAQ